MVTYFINYIMIGVLFAFIVDMATEYARKKNIEIPKQAEWNWETRIIAIWIWPIGMIFFFGRFFKEIFKNKDKNNK